MERALRAPLGSRWGRQPLTTLLLVTTAFVTSCRSQRSDAFESSDWSARVGPDADGKVVLRVQGKVVVPDGYATWLMLHSPPSINPSILELDLVPTKWADYSEEGLTRFPVTFATEVGAADAYQSVIIFYQGLPRVTLQCGVQPDLAQK